jgi:hypothetical protein
VCREKKDIDKLDDFFKKMLHVLANKELVEDKVKDSIEIKESILRFKIRKSVRKY